MTGQTIRKLCLALPHVTEHVQWEDHLVFKVADKSFVITTLEPRGHFASLKSTPERFSELVERPGFVPAPYLARSHWFAIEHADAVTANELSALIREAYDAVVAKLPKKTRQQMAATG